MGHSINDLLDNVQAQLGETLMAFLVSREINERCNPQTDPALSKMVNEQGGFWQPVLIITPWLPGDDCKNIYTSIPYEMKSAMPGIILRARFAWNNHPGSVGGYAQNSCADRLYISYYTEGAPILRSSALPV